MGGRGTRGMFMKSKEIEYHVAGTRYLGTLWVDDGKSGRRPGVLVAHEGGGLTHLAKSFARRLAESGYVAYAMDYYGDGRPVELGTAMPRIQAHMKDPSGIRAIATAALKVLTDQPE